MTRVLHMSNTLAPGEGFVSGRFELFLNVTRLSLFFHICLGSQYISMNQIG